MNGTDWNSLQFVLAVARHSSLERAARELGVDPSTVSRRIHALEQRVRVRIFDRTVAGHRLTSTGAAMLRTAEQVESSIAAMERMADGADDRTEGLIRIGAGDAIASRLPPLLARFQAQNPLVTFRVGGDVSSGALVRHEVHVAIRTTRPAQAQLASRRLLTLGFGLYVGAAYLRHHPVDLGGPLAGHRLLGYEERHSHLPEAQWLARRSDGARYVLRSSCLDVLAGAAASDLGLAVLPCIVADGDARLLRLAGPEQVVVREVWLVVHRDLRRVARLRAFVDFLAEEARSHLTQALGGLRAVG